MSPGLTARNSASGLPILANTPNPHAVLVDAKALKREWFPRNQRFETWYNLREMRDKNARPGYVSVALNDARTFFDLSLFFLSHKPPKVRVPVLGKPEAEQARSGEAERALAAIQRQINREHRGAGLGHWQRELSDYLLSTGWWADYNLVLKTNDNQPVFIADVLDPANVFARYGYKSAERIVHIYPASLALVRAKARELHWEGNYAGDGAQEVWVYNDFQRDDDGNIWNTVLVEGVTQARATIGPDGFAVAMPPQLTESQEIPLRTGNANGWATRSSRPGDTRLKQVTMGESILEAGRPIYDMTNLWGSYVMQIAHDTAQPTYMARGRGGRFTVSEQDLVAGIIPVDLDESIDAVRKPDIPASVASVIMPMLERGEQRAGISDLFFGNVQGLDLAGAGFAISLLEPNALSKLGDFAEAIEYVGSSRDSFYLEELRKGDFDVMRLSGRGSQDLSERRRVFYEEFNPNKLPEHSYVDWEVELATPSQLMQALTIARQAHPQGDLLDITTILEKLLKVDDPEWVRSEIELAETKRNPIVQTIEVLNQLGDYAQELRRQARGWAAAGDREQANRYRQAATRTEQQIEQISANVGGGQPALPPGAQGPGIPPGAPGLGIPPGAQGPGILPQVGGPGGRPPITPPISNTEVG